MRPPKGFPKSRTGGRFPRFFSTASGTPCREALPMELVIEEQTSVQSSGKRRLAFLRGYSSK